VWWGVSDSRLLIRQRRKNRVWSMNGTSIRRRRSGFSCRRRRRRRLWMWLHQVTLLMVHERLQAWYQTYTTSSGTCSYCFF
jgi:hypothetical protein